MCTSGWFRLLTLAPKRFILLLLMYLSLSPLFLSSTVSVLGKATCSKNSLFTDLFPPMARAWDGGVDRPIPPPSANRVVPWPRHGQSRGRSLGQCVLIRSVTSFLSWFTNRAVVDRCTISEEREWLWLCDDKVQAKVIKISLKGKPASVADTVYVQLLLCTGQRSFTWERHRTSLLSFINPCSRTQRPKSYTAQVKLPKTHKHSLINREREMGQDKRLGQRMIQTQPKLERYWQRAYCEYGQRHLEHCYQRICDQRLP